MVAGGVANAFATPGSATPGDSPSITVAKRGPLVEATNLYPTSWTHPDPQVVAKTRLPVAVTAPVRLTAECTCAPGSVEARQFADLAIEVTSPGHVYNGRLDALDVLVDKPVKDLNIRVWLVDDGTLQPQGVTTTWKFIAAPATWPA